MVALSCITKNVLRREESSPGDGDNNLVKEEGRVRVNM